MRLIDKTSAVNQGLNSDGVFQKSSDFDECVYIEDHEPNSKKTAMASMTAMNDYLNNNTLPQLEELAIEKLRRGEEITKEWVEQERSELIKNILPIRDFKLANQIQSGLSGLRYGIVLNRQQY